MEYSEVKSILQSFVSDDFDAEECFCLILSIDGYEHTRTKFLDYIDLIRLRKPIKHKQLYDVFVSYFRQNPSNEFTDPIEASVENGYLTSDFNYEIDVELALSQSMTASAISEEKKSETKKSVYDVKKTAPTAPNFSYASPNTSNLPSASFDPHASYQAVQKMVAQKQSQSHQSETNSIQTVPRDLPVSQGNPPLKTKQKKKKKEMVVQNAEHMNN